MPTDLAAQIKKARIEAGLSREKLAVALDVSLSTIVRWETGRTEPSVKKTLEVARVTQKPLQFFLGKAAA